MPLGALSGGSSVDDQPLWVLALGKAGFGGGHLAVDGQPDRLAVRRADIDRSGPPGVVDPAVAQRAGEHGGYQAGSGQSPGLDDTHIEVAVGQIRAVGGGRPLGLVPAIAGEI